MKINKANYINNKNLIIFLVTCVILILFISNPNKYIDASINGINVWALRLVPTLLPFMILTRIMISTNVPDFIGNKISPITSFLYGAPGCSGYIYLLSILSGYPMGAKLTYDMYKEGKINKQQAERICTFTSTSGPIFVIATVGANIFNSSKIGVLVFIAHVIGSLLNGLLYKKHSIVEQSICMQSSNMSLNDIIIDSIQSILVVGVYINVFFILITMINSISAIHVVLFKISEIINIDSNIVSAIFNGSIEMTKGCFDLLLCGLHEKANIVILSALISFGGLSTIFQSYSFLKNCGVKLKFFIQSKITQSIITILVAILITTTI